MKKTVLKKIASLAVITAFMLTGIHGAGASSILSENVKSKTGNRDSFILISDNGRVITAKNENMLLIPASTIKIITSLSAIHYLGEDYRFPVKFYLRANRDLVIEGFGDPMLVSEVVEHYCFDVSEKLAAKGILSINDIITDDTYFNTPPAVPGAETSSEQPYDAPVGALSINFNSVSFIKTENGDTRSAEPQTPLTSSAISAIKKSSLKSGRIPLEHDKSAINLHSGEIFKYFIEKNRIKITGSIRQGKIQSTDIHFFTAYSPYILKESLSRLLQFSSNFMANQIFLATAAKAFGKPANMEKGIKAAKLYAAGNLGIKNLEITEGSGLSRQNKISAVQMAKALDAFSEYCYLMKKKGNARFKTGTLDGVSARAGYIHAESGKMSRFVILMNSPGKNADSVLEFLKTTVKKQPLK